MGLSRHPRLSRERGIILWTTLFIVVVLGGLSAAFLYEGLGERTAVEQRSTGLLALQICEAGTLHGVMEITALQDASTDGVGNASNDFAGGSFEVAATQDATHPDRWTLRTQGTYRLSRKRTEVGIRRRVHSDWAEGMYARRALRFNGDIATDSYDSRVGTYASQAVNADAGGPYAKGNGHVGSNASIRTTGSSMVIRGNAIPGPLGTVDSSGTPTIWGDMLPRRIEVPLPGVPQADFEAALATNDNAGITWSGGAGGGKPPYDAKNVALVASGSRVVTLPGGTYFFSDVRFSGGAELRVTGPTVIYVTGQFDLGGGVLVNATGVPSDMIVYVHPYDLPGVPSPTQSEVKFNGGPAASLAVYAPEVDITVGGNNDVYGSLVGRDITTLGNASFHYDEALGAWAKFSKVFVERLYWRELNATLR